MPRLPVLMLQLMKKLGLAKLGTALVAKRMISPATKRKAFAGYAPSEHDVLVTTFAKSGTNWMMQIAQQIAYRGAAEFEHIHDVVPWPDAPGSPIGDLADATQIERSPTGLRVIKTHLETDFVPYDEKATYLAVLRDPKEVLVSSYYFLGGIFGVLRQVSIDDWFEICTRQGGLMQRWAVHTAGYWSWRDRPNVLVLTYPDIIALPVPAIERVAAKMGVDLTPEQRDAVVERSSFEYMKAHDSQFAPPRRLFVDTADPVAMVRRGRSGASDELLRPDQQREIDRLCAGELERLGSSFPYRELFSLGDG